MRRFIVSVFAVSLMVPAFSSALTIDQIQQQIAALLAQVAQLQQQIAQLPADRGTTTPTVPSSTTDSPDIVCPVFNSTLSRGGRGDAVTALQEFLADRGLLTSDAMTGFYGTLTESAVRNFQSQQGLVSSGDAATTGWGAVGKLTSAAIVRACSSQASTLTPGSKNPNACATVPVPSTSCDGTWTANMDSRSCVASWQCVPSQTSCTMQMLLCPTGQHRVVSGCSQSCVPNDSSGAPVITSVDGPATLNANQSGTWTVRASVPNQQNAAIRYSVRWGDEMNWLNNVAAGLSQASSVITTSGTFTHVFNYAGNFTPVFTVSNDSGSASFTSSVQVSGDGLNKCPIYAMTQSAQRIACPAGQHWESDKPTYDSNRCPMPYSGTCVPDVPTSSAFSASPTLGVAPLAVTFFSNIGGFPPPYRVDYTVDYGDGVREAAASCYAPSDYCISPGKNTHTYTNTGTYTATLTMTKYNNCQATGDSVCAAWVSSTEILGTVTITVGGGSGSNAALTVSSPAAGTVYKSGDTIPVSWSVSGINTSEISNYKIGYALDPVDAGRSILNSIGQMFYMSDMDSLPGLSGTKILKAPNGGWWSGGTNTSDINSRYRAHVAIGKFDPSMCSPGTMLMSSEKTFAGSLAIAQPQYLATSIAPCNPYRIIAFADSASVFTIKQPRVTGTSVNNASAKTVTVTVTVIVPDGCKSFELKWRDPQIGVSMPVSTYTPGGNCSSGQYSASFTQVFNYHSYGSFESVGGADLYYNNSFADSFNVGIPPR